MLPTSLLRIRTKKGMISPLFCSENEFQLATKIIRVFEEALERTEKKGVLLERIREYEYKNDYKLVRGLYTLLERRCIFKSTTNLNSIFVRKIVFEEASKRGFALTDFERDDILSSTARRIGVTARDIDEALWSDLDENMLLAKFDSINVNDLVACYNLSLFQTLLFNCTKLEFYISGGINWKRVLRNVKWLGLIYYLEQSTTGSDQLTCSLDGPLSLFRLTDKYGTSIAKLLPSITTSEKWHVRASIVRKTMAGKKLFELELSDKEAPLLIASAPCIKYKENTVSIYDSNIEEKFARKFEQFANGWKLVREPDPLIVEGKALIPDFMFQKYNTRVYLEIVGFWTKEYLERKLHKLIVSVDNKINILIAVNKELACSKLHSLPKEQLIIYKDEVPIKAIVDYLKRIERELIERSMTNVKITLDRTRGEIIPIKDIIQEYNIPEQTALKILSNNDEYIVVGKFLISKIITCKIDKLLDGITKFVDACSALAENSIPESCHAEMISIMGYDVIWKGLDVEKAILVKHK
ncbi:MAG: hypothetical protein CMO16_03775 [Thaumarchaeota archaeon]|nr:hypothetical protein [Nitrososphaerota archaeon]